MTKEQQERSVILMQATLDILNQCNDSHYVLDVMATTAIWDEVECDASCLKDELEDLIGEVNNLKN